MNTAAAIVLAVFLFICLLIGILEYGSERRLYRDLRDEALFKWKDAYESQVVDVYVRARLREMELLDIRYEKNHRESIGVEALIDALEWIASARGYKLPKDDEIFTEE